MSSAVAEHLGCEHRGTDITITAVTTLSSPQPQSLAFCSADIADLSAWSNACIIGPESLSVPASSAHIVSNAPRRHFGRAVQHFFVAPATPGIEDTARIHASAVIHATAYIGHYAVIEADVVVGAHCSIGAHVTLFARTLIGESVTIGANTVIGSVGFGLEEDENGEWVRIPHIGRVVIDDNVEIGSGVVIARGTINETHISRNCKIDDLVFIAHNVFLDENCVVIAHAEISGSVRIGRDCWIGPSSTIIQQVTIGANTLVGIGSVVLKDLPGGVVAAGNPAKVLRDR